ncbi:DUF6090 family protein [Arenibacter sp. GZD96]|uniref:DUF6090 family protein n=1 Tax=Aurantibrevibacter litoralis TaxID=3106030 RepID=UPI002AFE7706|nr:DUF6090 family protein [Arenibacter sp. GZD-96]MEA1786064.1 DUF6090 family protein [Arenibacter sp. GZD-96]
MIKLFRNIREKLIDQNKVSNYFFYAIGEILLVVIGILIALQINTWNESSKNKNYEIYLLAELRNNLIEDKSIIDEIIQKRRKAAIAINGILSYVPEGTMHEDSISIHLAWAFTFERYYPIGNAYEMLKFSSLQLSNRELSTQLSRYYEYEQNKAQHSIKDIESFFINIFEGAPRLKRHFKMLDKEVKVIVKDIHDPAFKDDLLTELIPFRDNNIGTLKTLSSFSTTNLKLLEAVDRELNDLK